MQCMHPDYAGLILPVDLGNRHWNIFRQSCLILGLHDAVDRHRTVEELKLWTNKSLYRQLLCLQETSTDVTNELMNVSQGYKKGIEAISPS